MPEDARAIELGCRDGRGSNDRVSLALAESKSGPGHALRVLAASPPERAAEIVNGAKPNPSNIA
jgi:hypothetical protein